MSIEEIVSSGDFVVEVDDWGGCHFSWPEDDLDGQPLSLTPNFMDKIQAAREKVAEEGADR